MQAHANLGASSVYLSIPKNYQSATNYYTD